MPAADLSSAHEVAPRVCSNCNKRESPDVKLLKCSACKVTSYCGSVCSVEHWKKGSHRRNCPGLKRAQEKMPEIQAISKQFPWVKQQADGTVTFEPTQGFRSDKEAGWWTEAPERDHEGRYVWGSALLRIKHLDARKGWMLPDDQIPWLDFAIAGSSPPKSPPSFEHTWASYYKWRGLPLDSRAALLLHWPMTIYRLLHQLGLALPDVPIQRRHLTVHLLGVEKELNFLPIFGELALLLPNTDLDLVLYGQGVSQLVVKAKGKPSCLASQQHVFKYTAPKISGGGTVRIKLWHGANRAQFWPGEAAITWLRSNKPDALIACNAGLGSYSEWRPVVLASRAFAIPFAITDYQEISLDINVRLILKTLPEWQGFVWQPNPDLTPIEQQRLRETPNASYIFGPNPFMRPGPRDRKIYALDGGPFAINGHEMIVTPGLNNSV